MSGGSDDVDAGSDRARGSGAGPAPVASLDELAPAEAGSEGGSAPVASFDPGQIGAARADVPVADLGQTAVRQAGRRLWAVDADDRAGDGPGKRTSGAGSGGGDSSGRDSRGGGRGRRARSEIDPASEAADQPRVHRKTRGRVTLSIAEAGNVGDLAGPGADHGDGDPTRRRAGRRRAGLSPEMAASVEAAARTILEQAERQQGVRFATERPPPDREADDHRPGPDLALDRARNGNDNQDRARAQVGDRSRPAVDPASEVSDQPRSRPETDPAPEPADQPRVRGRGRSRNGGQGGGQGGDQGGDRSRDGRRARKAEGTRTSGGGRDRTSGHEPEPDADPLAVARAICLRLLTERARSRHELEQALRRRAVPEEAVRAMVERLKEVGLIDDAGFAEQWVQSRHNGKGLGRHALVVELRRKGVADEVAGEALDDLDTDAEEQRARQLVDRKLRTMVLDSPEQRAVAVRRLAGMLARKGYGAGVAYRVVREAIAAHGADVEELGIEHLDD